MGLDEVVVGLLHVLQLLGLRIQVLGHDGLQTMSEATFFCFGSSFGFAVALDVGWKSLFTFLLPSSPVRFKPFWSLSRWALEQQSQVDELFLLETAVCALCTIVKS